MLASVLAYTIGGGVISALESAVTPPRQPRSPLAPPRAAIPLVWTVLFGMMGVARASLHDPRDRRALDRLWLLCALYPLYTAGLRFRTGAVVGNAVIAAESSRLALRHASDNRLAAAMLAPLPPWALYATAIVLTDRR